MYRENRVMVEIEKGGVRWCGWVGGWCCVKGGEDDQSKRTESCETKKKK